ncbi:uncharacterized protein LOC143255026 [Tachypleus tridentatus]|uniref:uncharacterized protein LOC143255026 n=1 Tax=Tachypleus tridentatus TaxID=6853 RepID=UPI003FD4DA97
MDVSSFLKKASISLLTLNHLWLGILLVCCMGADVRYRNEDEDRCNKTVDIHQSISNPPVTDRNRGRSLHCNYEIRVRPARDDWVIFVKFIRMRVGETSTDRRQCLGGYLQIIDGFRDSNTTNKNAPGFFCGEIDSPKTFISETPYVKIVFHVDTYNEGMFLQFMANVERQSEVLERYGQYPYVYPHRRGQPVPDTYCERVFKDCSSSDRCYVQSPGYPGVYPPSLQCEYHLSVPKGVIGLELQKFDVDGQGCDSLLYCFPRPVTTTAEECPFDYVRIHDGPSVSHPVIVTLCGRGRLRSNIIGSSSVLLVRFNTSPAGPLLNTGFHFKAYEIYDNDNSEPLELKNGSCIVEKYLEESDGYLFSSLRSWYPENTTCTYKFRVDEDEIIALDFLWYRIERVTLCEDSLKMYDHYEADPRYIIVKLCDMNRPQTEESQRVYESSGPVMFVEFIGKTGSLEGSSLSYKFRVKKQTKASQNGIFSNPSCNQVFSDDSKKSDVISVGKNDLLSIKEGDSIVCNYTFIANSISQGRVVITILGFFKSGCDSCRGNGHSWISIHSLLPEEDSFCFCEVDKLSTFRLTSPGPRLLLVANFTRPSKQEFSSLIDNEPYLQIEYGYTEESQCGPEQMELELQGEVDFPAVMSGPKKPGLLYCRWSVPVFHGMDVSFVAQNLYLPGNCSTNYLSVGSVYFCEDSSGSMDRNLVIENGNIKAGKVIVEFRTTDASNSSFSLVYTQLKMLQPSLSSDSLVSLDKECEFLCAPTMACLKKELVCNGVPNCPVLEFYDTGGVASDEATSLCYAEKIAFPYYWWVIGVAVAICICAVFCFGISLCRRWQTGRKRL